MKKKKDIWLQNPDIRKRDDGATVIARVRKRTNKILLEDGRINHRNKRQIRTRTLAEWPDDKHRIRTRR